MESDKILKYWRWRVRNSSVSWWTSCDAATNGAQSCSDAFSKCVVVVTHCIQRVRDARMSAASEVLWRFITEVMVAVLWLEGWVSAVPLEERMGDMRKDDSPLLVSLRGGSWPIAGTFKTSKKKRGRGRGGKGEGESERVRGRGRVYQQRRIDTIPGQAVVRSRRHHHPSWASPLSPCSLFSLSSPLRFEPFHQICI